MKPNIHCIQLSNENIEKYRKMESFIQPGVCFSIAPNLDHCKECASQRKRYARKEVDCRFYQFRKLRFNGDEIEVVGFLSSIDPIQVDRTVWLPIEKSKFKIPLQESRLMLQYCGDELCYIIEKDKSYLHKYKCENSELIWKRTIERVSEICDLCSTTLFNLHFICSICGISLCFDCIDESKDGSFDISCSIPDKEAHTHADLKLTQIIVEDSMDKLQKLLHETCLLWNIDHKCDLSHVKIENSKRNLAKNMLLEHQTGKNTLNREIPQKLVSIEKVRDFLQIPLEQNNLYVEEEFDIDTAMNEIMIQPNEKLYNVKTEKKIMKPLRHFTESEREVIISIPRFMNQESSNVIYPNVPHSWLCKGKLLRLHDPNNPKNTEVFEDQWKRGQPVIISNIGLDKNLWIPQSFAKEFGKDTSDFVNCLNGNLVKYREMSEFWDGFEYVSKRILDNSGKPILLKLKDWPPDSDFKNIMPSRFEDFMNNLPFSSYTHRNGDLNIIKYLPTCFLHPDLGPKGYFAYGDPFFKKEGTTNLHLDVSDACNVMCYVGFPRDKDMSTYLQEGYNAMIEADCDRANIMRVIEQGEIPGAIWHIYQAADADRIRDFILKISYEKGLKYAPGHDVIHDQNWYLNKEMRQRLLDEYSVEGYAIVQCIGDCVVLPAGTPHQVRNIYSW
jgi:[histone H3]-dimethyl-L-lysine9 demethylase